MNVATDFPLKTYNTFGINAYAKHFSVFNNVEELKTLLSAFSNEKKLILGGGSNILLTRNYDGLVLKNNICGIELVNETDQFYYIKANSGEVWHDFVMHCIKHNYAGIENLSLIPGSVGASPMQNIGAYGVEIKDVFHELEALDVRNNELRTFNLRECAFGYRESVFKKELSDIFIILNVTYRLSKIPHIKTTYGAINSELEKLNVSNPGIQDVSRAVINIRKSKLPDPKKIGNAGSFFKNPVISTDVFKHLQTAYADIPFYSVAEKEDQVKIPAGWLIEKAGWKGYRKKDFGVHTQQALVLVNYGQASGCELAQLSQTIIADIHSKFGIKLKSEVNII